MKKFTREAFSLRAGEARKVPPTVFLSFPAPPGTDHARDQEWEAPFVSCQRFFSPSSSIQISNNYNFFPAKVMPTSGTWKVPFRGKFGAYDCAGGGDNRGGGGGGGGQPQPKEYFQVESRYSWSAILILNHSIRFLSFSQARLRRGGGPPGGAPLLRAKPPEGHEGGPAPQVQCHQAEGGGAAHVLQEVTDEKRERCKRSRVFPSSALVTMSRCPYCVGLQLLSSRRRPLPLL